MLTLDPFSENVLYQCDRCRWVGELLTDVTEEDGVYSCWACLGTLNKAGQRSEKLEEANIFR